MIFLKKKIERIQYLFIKDDECLSDPKSNFKSLSSANKKHHDQQNTQRDAIFPRSFKIKIIVKNVPVKIREDLQEFLVRFFIFSLANHFSESHFIANFA